MYCAKFVHLIHTLKTPNFSTLLCYDRVNYTNTLSPFLGPVSICQQKKTLSFILIVFFLSTDILRNCLFGNIMHWKRGNSLRSLLVRYAWNSNALAFQSGNFWKRMCQLSRFCDKIPHQQSGNVHAFHWPLKPLLNTVFTKHLGNVFFFAVLGWRSCWLWELSSCVS